MKLRVLWGVIVIGSIAFGGYAVYIGLQRQEAAASRAVPKATTAPVSNAASASSKPVANASAAPDPSRDRAGVGAPPPGRRPHPLVEIATARRGPWVEWRTALGTVKSLRQIEATSMATAPIRSIASSGSLVRKGETLFQLDDRKVQAQLQSKIAVLTLARDTYARDLKLAGRGVAALATLQAEQMDVRLAAAEVAYQRALLDQYRIVADFDGEVGFHDLVPGQVVKAGQSVFNFQDTGALQVQFQIPLEYVHLVSRLGTVQVRNRESAFSGKLKILKVSPEVDEQTQTVQMRALLPTGTGLRPGTTLRIRFESHNSGNVTSIPDLAVVQSAYGAFVFVVGEHGEIARRFVKIDGRQTGRVAVSEGIHPGDTVVVTGQMRLYPGVSVDTRPFRAAATRGDASAAATTPPSIAARTGD